MKRFLAVLAFTLVFSVTAQTVFAAEYDITEFQGDNGLVFHNPAFQSGDILNIMNDITDLQGISPTAYFNNMTITIRGNGHTIKGYEQQYSSDTNITAGFCNMGNNSVFTIENAVLTNFSQYQLEDIAVGQSNGILNVIDTDIINNTFSGIDPQAGALRLYSARGYIKAINKDVVFSGNGEKPSASTVPLRRDIYMSNNSMLYFLPSSGKTISIMEGIAGDGYLQVGNIDALNPNNPIGDYDGTLVLGGNNEDFGNPNNYQVTQVDSYVDVYGATVKLLAGAKYFHSDTKNSYNNGTLDLQNDAIDQISMSSLSIMPGTNMNLKIDVDLKAGIGDKLESGDYTGDQGAPVIKNINLLSETEQDTVYVPVLEGYGLQNAAVLDPSMEVVDGKVYSYNVALINENDPTAPAGNPYLGNLKFTRGLFNAPAMGASYAVQGVRLLQEELSYVLFENVGNFSFFEKAGASAGDIPRDKPTMWLKAFSVDSELDFGKYGKADADYYGAMGGLDFDRLYKGFDAVYGFFGSYISGKQKGSISTTEQSGGYAGGKATFYFGKLFFSGILDAGLLNNSLETTAGTDEFKSNVYAATLKGGYNFELSKRNFTLQPNITAGFSYIDTEDYTNSLGVKIETDDVSLFTLMPGVKLAKNLGKCWILSADGHYVYSSVNGDLKADSIILPDNEYDNYFRYSACIEKIWGYTVAHLRAGRSDGGRSGWNLSAGIEWKF